MRKRHTRKQNEPLPTHRPIPAGITTILGHDHPLSILSAALQSERMAHAYLFSGPDGIGKRLCALRWAMAINCDNRRGSADLTTQPCRSGDHRCRACTMGLAGTHPDLLMLEPDGQFLKIEQIRAMQSALTYTPWSGQRKIAVIDRAERLNQEAANALLKTLEEPPEASLLLLISGAPDDLLPTIRSRCQRIRFFPLEQEQLAQWLITTHHWSHEDAQLVNAVAQGSIGKALASDPAQLRQERDTIDQWLMEACLNPAGPHHGLMQLVEGAEAFAHTAEQFERTLRWLLLWIQEISHVKIGGAAAPESVRFPSAHASANHLSTAACCEAAEQLHWSWRASFRNINRQLMLEQWVVTLRQAMAATAAPSRPVRRPYAPGAHPSMES